MKLTKLATIAGVAYTVLQNPQARFCIIGALDRFQKGTGRFEERQRLIHDPLQDNPVSGGAGSRRVDAVLGRLPDGSVAKARGAAGVLRDKLSEYDAANRDISGDVDRVGLAPRPGVRKGIIL